MGWKPIDFDDDSGDPGGKAHLLVSQIPPELRTLHFTDLEGAL